MKPARSRTRNSRILHNNGSVAQLVEQLPLKQLVVGSNPTRSTILEMMKKSFDIGLSKALTNLRPLSMSDVSSEERVVGCDITGEASQGSLDSLELNGCKLSDVQFAGHSFERLDAEGCELVQCDVANAKLEHSLFRNVTFSGCRLTGASFSRSNLKKVLLKDCKANLASFRFCTFADCRFENCDFQGADFQGSDLSKAVFRDCNLTRAQMSQAILHGADVRTCNIDDVRIGIPELKGVILSNSQFLLVADLLGIIVKEVDFGGQ